MRINKLLVASTLAIPAAVTPLGVMTSCAGTWGTKTPISMGSVIKDNPNNPYYNFLANANEYLDIDGLAIPNYIQSNYISDIAGGVNYAYTTPVETWYDTVDNKSTKRTDTNTWVNGSSLWASPSTGMTSSISQIVEVGGQKYNTTQTCSKNLALTANIAFVNTIGQFINKLTAYAINYATSQLKDANDFAVAWGGTTPKTTTDDNKNRFYEWIFANSNAHASGRTDTYLKTTSVNFNFDAQTFPIPTYTAQNGEPSKHIKKLLTGSETGKLGEVADESQPIYWSEKTESGKDADKYTVYTYPSVPVIIHAKDITQRFINPKKNGSIFVSDYYQNDKSAVEKSTKDKWDGLKEYTGYNTPQYYKYELKTSDNPKAVSYETNETDARLAALKPSGKDFVAFITYNYIEWAVPNAALNRNNSVTLSSLQTVVPAYLLQLQKPNIWTKAKSDKNNSGYYMNVSKIDDYTNELINLLSRNSSQGRVAKASDLNNDSKQYLQFLNFLFSEGEELDSAKFVNAFKWGE